VVVASWFPRCPQTSPRNFVAVHQYDSMWLGTFLTPFQKGTYHHKDVLYLIIWEQTAAATSSKWCGASIFGVL